MSDKQTMRDFDTPTPEDDQTVRAHLQGIFEDIRDWDRSLGDLDLLIALVADHARCALDLLNASPPSPRSDRPYKLVYDPPQRE